MVGLIGALVLESFFSLDHIEEEDFYPRTVVEGRDMTSVMRNYDKLGLDEKLFFLREKITASAGDLPEGCYNIVVEVTQDSGPQDKAKNLSFYVPFENREDACLDFAKNFQRLYHGEISTEGLMFTYELNGNNVAITFEDSNSQEHRVAVYQGIFWHEYGGFLHETRVLEDMLLTIGSKYIFFDSTGETNIEVKKF